MVRNTMVEYQTAKDNVDRILGTVPLEKELGKKERIPSLTRKNPMPGSVSWHGVFLRSSCFFCLKMLLFVQCCGKLFLDAAIDGRRLAPLEIPEGLRPSVHIETHKGIWERRAKPYGYFRTYGGVKLRPDLLRTWIYIR